jgi:hypothetical protein
MVDGGCFLRESNHPPAVLHLHSHRVRYPEACSGDVYFFGAGGNVVAMVNGV